jgi:DNA-binding response OmpR family regulator
MNRDMAKILLVEDEADLRLLIQAQLGVAGFECEVAASLDEARSKLAGAGFDVVLLDLYLGAESGWVLVEELGRSPGRPAVVVISAYDEEKTKERAAAAGCEWLPKPFTPMELSSTLARILPSSTSAPRPPEAS